MRILLSLDLESFLLNLWLYQEKKKHLSQLVWILRSRKERTVGFKVYSVYIDNILLPVTPEKITWSYKGQNDTVNLINMEEISRVRTPGLMEYSFKALLPGGDVPYARYLTSFKEPFVYIYELEQIINEQKAVMFYIIREKLPYKRVGFTTKKLVTIESINVLEEASEGLDVILDIKLKEYKTAQSTNITGGIITSETNRQSTKEIAKTYVVKEGDNLWNICKSQLNDGSKCYDIAKINGISNPSLIYAGQVIRFE